MDSIIMRTELHDYIDHADEKEIELLYTLWSNKVLNKYEWWTDEELIAVIEKRSVKLKREKEANMFFQDVKKVLLDRLNKNNER